MSTCINPSDRKDVTATPAVPNLVALDVERAIRVVVSHAAVFHTLAPSAKARVITSIVDVLTDAFVSDLRLCMGRVQRIREEGVHELGRRGNRGGTERDEVDGIQEARKRRAEDAEEWHREKGKTKRVRSEDSSSTMSDLELKKDGLVRTRKHDGAVIDTNVYQVEVDNEAARKAWDKCDAKGGKKMTKNKSEEGEGVKRAVAKVKCVIRGPLPFQYGCLNLDFSVVPTATPDSRGSTVDGSTARVHGMVPEGAGMKRIHTTREFCSLGEQLIEVGGNRGTGGDILVDETTVADKAANVEDGARAVTEASSVDETALAVTRERSIAPRASSHTAGITAANTARTIEPMPNIQTCSIAEIFAVENGSSVPAALAARRTLPSAESPAASSAGSAIENQNVTNTGLKLQDVRLTRSQTRSLPTSQRLNGQADMADPNMKTNRKRSPGLSQTIAEASLIRGNRSNVEQDVRKLEVGDQLEQDMLSLGKMKRNPVKQHNGQWNIERTEEIQEGSMKMREVQQEEEKLLETEEIEMEETEPEKQKGKRQNINHGMEKRLEARQAILQGHVMPNKRGWCGEEKKGQEMRGRENGKGKLERKEIGSEDGRNKSNEKSGMRKQHGKTKLEKAKVEQRKRENQGSGDGDYETDLTACNLRRSHTGRKMMKMVSAQIEDDAEDSDFSRKARPRPSRSRSLQNLGHTELPWWHAAGPDMSRAIKHLNNEEAFRGLILAMIRSSICKSWSADNLREQYHQDPSSPRGRAFLAVSSSLFLMERARHIGQCRLEWKRQLMVELLGRRDIEWSIVQGDPSFPHFVGCEACQKYRRATRRIRLAGPGYDSRNFWPSNSRISILSAKYRSNCVEVSAELNAETKRFPYEHNIAKSKECELFVDAECLRKCLVFHELAHFTSILAEDIRLMIEGELGGGNIRMVRESEGKDECISNCLVRHLIDILSQNTEFLKRWTAHFIDLVELGNIYFSASDAEVLDSGAGIKPETAPKASRIYDAPIELNDDEHKARVHKVESLTKKKSLVTSFATLC